MFLFLTPLKNGKTLPPKIYKKPLYFAELGPRNQIVQNQIRIFPLDLLHKLRVICFANFNFAAKDIIVISALIFWLFVVIDCHIVNLTSYPFTSL